MKAWKREYEERKKARPKDFEEEPADWSGFEGLAEQRNQEIKLLWHTEVPGSWAPECFHLGMVQAWANRGYDVKQAEELVEEGLEALAAEDYRQLEVISARIRQALRNAPRQEGHEYWLYDNPETWPEIKAAFPLENSEEDLKTEAAGLSAAEAAHRIHYGWLGQIAGGSYGTALEGYRGEVLREFYKDQLDYYVREPETYNDDITFQLAFLKALEEKGEDVTADDIAARWLELIPFGWSAEYIALENLRRGLFPPRSGSFDNFFSEWIGAQMRGMVCGFVAPGRPMKAAEYAYQDAIVSHEKNGVYGEIHSAVLTSLAFIFDNTRELVRYSRNYLPEGSQFVYLFDRAVDVAETSADHLEAWQKMEEEIKKYNWVHTYPNMVAVVFSLWYGEGDFRKSMRILAECGMDVDCNAGEVGSALGVMNTDSIDSSWFKPFNNTLKTYVPGFEEIKISQLAEWTSNICPYY